MALKSIFACLCTDDGDDGAEKESPEDDIEALMRKYGNETPNAGQSNDDD